MSSGGEKLVTSIMWGTVARRVSILVIVPEKSKMDWWFTGSLVLLGISILGFAYLLWENYSVTTK